MSRSFADQQLNFSARTRVRAAFRQLAADINPNFFLTFDFGYLIKPQAAFPRLKGFCAAIERRSLGRSWYKYQPPDRLVLLAFPERLDLNPHWHAVAHIPEPMVRSLWGYASEIWLKYSPRAQRQLDFSRIDDVEKVISYVTKRTQVTNNLENIFVYGPNSPKGANHEDL